MAKEITALQSVKERDGTVKWQVFYHFPISPRVQDADGSDIVPLASSGIPALAQGHFTQAELTALNDAVDAGDQGYATAQVEQTPGETGAAFAARLKLHWAATRDFRVQQWRDQWAQAGTQISAP